MSRIAQPTSETINKMPRSESAAAAAAAAAAAEVEKRLRAAEMQKAEEPPEKKPKMSEVEKSAAVEKKKPESAVEDVMSQIEKLRAAVDEDATDFAAWTSLLQFVDANTDLERRFAVDAFDDFLFRYPYCYGYWKKYADFEKRRGNSSSSVMAVFERGIEAIPLSVDLWIHYLNHVKASYADDADFVRAQFERAVLSAGREWRADKLWDAYIKWEAVDQKRLPNVLNIYDRILATATQGLSNQFDVFKGFVEAHQPSEILEDEELEALKRDLDEDKESDLPPGSAEEETKKLREAILSERKKIFDETSKFAAERYAFEDAIKRPYFHMKPLERGQLKNWNDYLDFEIKVRIDF